MRSLVLWLALVALAACSSPPARIPSGSANDPLVVTLVPSVGIAQTAGDELAKLLERKTQFSYQVQVAPSPAASLESIRAGNAQIGWLDTFTYIVARKRHRVQVSLVAVRNGSDHTRSQIIANKEAGIKSLGDLKGKTFCFADSTSIAGYLVPRIILQANSIDLARDLRVSYAGSTSQVAAAVAKRECDAGAVIADPETWASEARKTTDQMMVIDTSPLVPNDSIAFADGFPKEQKDSIVQALIEIASTEAGRRLLKIEGFSGRDDAFYDRLRDMLTKAGADVGVYVK